MTQLDPNALSWWWALLHASHRTVRAPLLRALCSLVFAGDCLPCQIQKMEANVASQAPSSGVSFAAVVYQMRILRPEIEPLAVLTWPASELRFA